VDSEPLVDVNEFQDPAAIDLLLDETEVWAVVGLSGNQHRAAFSVAADLQAHGKRIVPIHPTATAPVLGETVYPTLADVPFPVEVVDVFRRSEAAGEFADQAVTIGAKGVWFQMGVVDLAAFERTRAAGVLMVMDLCPSKIWWHREARGI
jgi:predicted CoA-binding protein